MFHLHWPFKEVVNWDDANPLHGDCQTNNKWEQVTGDVPPPMYGKWMQPALLVHKGLLNPSLKVWVDDVAFLCN